MMTHPLLYLPSIPHADAATSRQFNPPSASAILNNLYEHMILDESAKLSRLTRKTNHQEIFIFIDEFSLENDTSNARSGYGIQLSHKCRISSRLEKDGPQTSNRAEFRAVIVALELRAWNGKALIELFSPAIPSMLCYP